MALERVIGSTTARNLPTEGKSRATNPLSLQADVLYVEADNGLCLDAPVTLSAAEEPAWEWSLNLFIPPTRGPAVHEHRLETAETVQSDADSGSGNLVSGLFDKLAALSSLPDEARLAVNDLRTFLDQLRASVDEIEASAQKAAKVDLVARERALLESLSQRVTGAMQAYFGRFEDAGCYLEAHHHGAFSEYVKEQLHPLVMCSPFMHRCFTKPLGYPGDYGMIDMMMTDPWRGETLYAKLLNSFFLKTAPVEAHRNRLHYLTDLLATKAAAVLSRDEPLKIYSLGCGPAHELQDFVRKFEFPLRAEFTLVDFSSEALDYVAEAIKKLEGHSTVQAKTHTRRSSVARLLKEAAARQQGGATGCYDVAYAAGLFDYLSDEVCKQVTALLYRHVRPGGMLVVTNVSRDNPSRMWMDHAVDWHLYPREAEEMSLLCPTDAPGDEAQMLVEKTGVNVFLTVRKPENETVGKQT